MKPFLLILLVLSGYASQAQSPNDVTSNSVPSEVRNAFLKTFPTAKVSWEKEKDGDYEGTFNLKGNTTSATYDKTGHLKEIESEIAKSALPKTVLTYVEQNYPGKKIREASQITNSQNVSTYEVEIREKGKSRDLIFDANGKFIK